MGRHHSMTPEEADDIWSEFGAVGPPPFPLEDDSSVEASASVGAAQARSPGEQGDGGVTADDPVAWRWKMLGQWQYTDKVAKVEFERSLGEEPEPLYIRQQASPLDDLSGGDEPKANETLIPPPEGGPPAWPRQRCRPADPGNHRPRHPGSGSGLSHGEGSMTLPVETGVVEALREACDEIADLRRYANNHGGMYDDETYAEGLAALVRYEASLGSSSLREDTHRALPLTVLNGLAEVVMLADELVNGGGLVNRGVDRGLVVVEKADKSDPHYRLCDALERLEKVRQQAAVSPQMKGAAK